MTAWSFVVGVIRHNAIIHYYIVRIVSHYRIVHNRKSDKRKNTIQAQMYDILSK